MSLAAPMLRCKGKKVRQGLGELWSRGVGGTGEPSVHRERTSVGSWGARGSQSERDRWTKHAPRGDSGGLASSSGSS
jgi:hypothetical protein